SQMMRVAVGRMGLELTWEALQESEWNDQQLGAMQHCWERIDFLEALEKGMEGQRCEGMEILGILRASKWRWQGLPGVPASSTKPHGEELAVQNLGRLFVRTTAERDLLLTLRHTQSGVELVRSLQAGRSWKEVNESLERLSARIERLSTSQTRILFLFTILALPNTTSAFRTAVGAETERRLAVTAIALKRYEH